MAYSLRWVVAVALVVTGAGAFGRDEADLPEEVVEDPSERARRAAEHEEAAEDRADAARSAERAKQLAKSPPTEAKLSVPLYPGARFDPEISASMDMGDGADYFVFFTRDAPGKVAQFYERKTGKKGLGSLGSGGVLFAVRGSPPWPELGVTVQPNAIAEGWRKGMPSLITVRKKR
jgi:hypothetical protein